MTNGNALLSTKPIDPAERLILALDVADADEARRLVERLGDAVSFYKVGLELLMAGGAFALIDWLAARDKRVFADFKLFDVPQTVASAMRRIAARPVAFTTVHGNDAIIEAAVAEKGGVGVLAVTVLTSLDQGDMQALGFAADIRKVVLERARRALALGCDGIVSSGLEVEGIRHALGPKLAVVVPGIRPGLNRPADDQKRTVDVEEAFRNGADYIVIGRPIRGAADPRAAALDVQARIRRLFAGD